MLHVKPNFYQTDSSITSGISLALQQMICRKIFHQKTDFRLDALENKIHDICENIINNNSDTDELEKEIQVLTGL